MSYCTRLCEEKDTQSLFDFFDNKKLDYLDIYAKECEVTFEHPIIRRGLYLHLNEYIGIFEENRILGLMSLYFYGDNTNTYYINYISLKNEENFKEIIDFIKNHNLILLKKLSKLRCLLDSGDKNSIQLLTKYGFIIENVKNKENTISLCLVLDELKKEEYL